MARYGFMAALLAVAATGPACSQAQTARAPAAQATTDQRAAVAGRLVGFRQMKRLDLALSGQPKPDTILYGRFGRTLAAGNRQVVIRNLVSPGERESVAAGDFGLLLISANARDPVVIYPSGELEYFRTIGPGDTSDFAECWQGQGRKRGVFAGTETANGVVHYAKGWRWMQCGD